MAEETDIYIQKYTKQAFDAHRYLELITTCEKMSVGIILHLRAEMTACVCSLPSFASPHHTLLQLTLDNVRLEALDKLLNAHLTIVLPLAFAGG